MTVDMLLFNQVRAGNLEVIGKEFVDIAREALLPLKEGNFWWEELVSCV